MRSLPGLQIRSTAENSEKINARLEDYIYLNKYNTSHKWVIIGDSQEHPYKGTFDGNGQKIVYMNVEISGNMPGKNTITGYLASSTAEVSAT